MTGKYNRKIKRGIVMPVQQFIVTIRNLPCFM